MAIQKLTEIKDMPMNLENNKTTEKTEMGDSKHATDVQVGATPDKTDNRRNRFDRKRTVEKIEETPIGETQITLPSTMPYGGLSVNNALFEATGEIESGQIVPAITDEMETGEEEIVVESMMSDHDTIRMLVESVKILKTAMIKGREETDEELEKLRQEIKKGKLGCENCKRDTKGKWKEVVREKTNIPYIPKQIVRREEVPTFPAPILNPFWDKRPSFRESEETFATKAKKANPDGFTEVLKRGVKVKDTKLGELRKVYVAPERERRLSMRFNRRKGGKQGLPDGITTEDIQTRINETLKGLNVDGYFAKAEKTRMGDVHMCLSKTRAANIIGAKEAMTECLEQMGLQEFEWVPDTKKVKIYISDVPLKRDGFGEDGKPEDWHGENAFDSLAADIERSNPGIFICARPSWVGKLHVMKNRKSWKAGLIVLCEETDSLKIMLGRGNPGY